MLPQDVRTKPSRFGRQRRNECVGGDLFRPLPHTYMTNQFKETALNYLDRGFNVIPLGTKSKFPNGKALISTGHKKIVDGKEKGSWEIFQTEAVTEELIDKWWTHTPQSNIGIVTGRISKLVVVDVDPRNSGDKSMKNLHLPPTYIVNTGGGGWHYYYLWPHENDAPNQDFADGIEIKGNGGYVVAPPSIHDKTHKAYVAANEVAELSEAPEWLVSLGKQQNKEKLWEQGLDGVSEGKRNDTATSICGKILSLLPTKLWKTAGWGGLKEWNCQNPKPLEEKELRNVFESICSRADDKGDDENGNDSIAGRIVNLILKENPVLLHDDLQKTYARIAIDEHEEVHGIYSRRFKDWVVRQFHKAENNPPKGESIKQALDVVHSKAIFDGALCNLSIRVAEHENAIWYDLTNKSWETVKIDADGWSVQQKSPPVFKRFSHQLEQMRPEQSGDLHRLLDYVNLKDESQRLLLLVYIASCFVPNIPHPIPVLHGSQGAAKSTFMRVIRRIIDPSKTELLTLPTRSEQLVQQLSHHWAPYYDNVTSIPDWISDALCRAVTGDGFTKRELYTDDEDVIYSFRCCIGLNGINIAAQKADLLDRSILFGLERIPTDKRKDEKTFWSEFKRDQPLILGAVFDALSKAMTIKETVHTSKLPRMADFAIWGAAIAEAIGYTQNDFVQAYQRNLEEQNEEAIREHPVATAVRAFMEDRAEWSGTSSDLLEELIKVAEKEKLDLRQRLWPKAAQALSRRLNEAKTNLAQVGISISTLHGKSRSILICKNSVDSVVSSQEDNNDDDNGNPATSEQDALRLIQEHLDPNAHYKE